jgi:mono/diheme cytochrome c family protein
MRSTGMSKSFIALVLLATAAGLPAAGAAEKQMSDAQVRQLFASVCGFCHENGGRTAGKGPQLMGTKRSDAFIINRIKQGKEGLMPSFEGNLTDAQIRAIVHYIRNLK